MLNGLLNVWAIFFGTKIEWSVFYAQKMWAIEKKNERKILTSSGQSYTKGRTEALRAFRLQILLSFIHSFIYSVLLSQP